MEQTKTTAARAPKITVIDPRQPKKAKLRVAAYARVSSDSADQENSYLAQVDYYTKYISDNPGWELVDIYADEGLSGLDTRKRDDFNRMIADCRAGKVDRVLVKSMSRFARNTQDYLQYMRELLRLGVSIRFEKENIDTGKMTSEQIAAIYASFAQMESTGHSKNMRTSVRMRMEKGLFVPPHAPYGYRLNGQDLEIISDEAETVRWIYAAYLTGQGQHDIARKLNEKKIRTSVPGALWHYNAVHYILTNVSYTGDMLWQKTYATDTIPICQKLNQGQKPQYFVEDCHEPIISKEDFQRVQSLMAGRRQAVIIERSAPILQKRAFCGICGTLCRKKSTRGKNYWVCQKHIRQKSLCPAQAVPEPELINAMIRCRNKLRQAPALLQTLLEDLKAIRERELRMNSRISDIDKEIARVSEQNLVLTRLKSKGYVDPALYLSQVDELTEKLKNLRRLRRNILDSSSEDGQIQATEAIISYLEDLTTQQENVTPDIFDTLIDCIILEADGNLRIRLQNGLELEEHVERAVR